MTVHSAWYRDQTFNACNFFIALATSEAGQPPPYSNMWTLYCLTDMNQQSRPSPPPALGPFPQATLYLPNPKDPQFLQNPPKVTSPTYVMMDDRKKTNAPPFILVGSSVQQAQDWKPLPGHTVVSQSDALKRYAAVQVPIAVPADQTFQRPSPNPQNASPPTSGQDVPRLQSPVFLSVAFPVEDVAKKRQTYSLWKLWYCWQKYCDYCQCPQSRILKE